ncbi:MAG TPA: hypothetical protein VHM91_22295 [Verrucomicrobiales bacterium]|jgi:uncharacterized metal-binding protein YceD (DUF177 family)|nr:hypothetical protein [Verrucomicrobiales bacterium]
MFHNIHLNELPPDGKVFEGEIRNDLFHLTAKDDPRFVPPVAFSLTVKLDGPDVVVEGSINARFELECARCGQWFPMDVELGNYYSQEERDGRATLDLTALIREDILLALPGYPRCEDSNVESRTCPAEGKFPAESEFTPLEEAETGEPQHRDVWDALDQIQPSNGAPRRPNS